MIRLFALLLTATVATGLSTASALAAGTDVPSVPVQKKPLDYHAYAAWRSIRDTHVSRDGRWVAYTEAPAEADGALVVRDLTRSTTFRSALGKAPAFTSDSRFVVFGIAPPLAETKAAEKAETPPEKQPKPGLGIMQLPQGSVTTIDRVRSFKLARDASTLAYLIEPSPAPSTTPSAAAVPKATPVATSTPGASEPTPAHGPGKDAPTALAIRRLDGGDPTIVANVSAYALSADGSRIVYVVQRVAEESIHVRTIQSGDDRTIAHGTAHLIDPTLSSNGETVAYLADPSANASPTPKKEAGARSPYRLMIANVREATPTEAFGDMTGTFASDAVPLEFSADGKGVAFHSASVPTPRPSSAPARVDVDFWYWRDGELPTQQRRDAEDPRNGAYLAIYDIAAKKTVQLESFDVPTVTLAKDAPYALGISNEPYVKRATYDTTYWDVYRIDVGSGARMRLLTAAKGNPPQLSPTGAYAAGYDPVRRAWYSLRMRDGRKTWMTDSRTIRAAVEDDDHPGEPPSYGFGGWGPGDATALVYDRYDIFAVSPDGGPARALTNRVGRATKRIYRVARIRTDEPASAFAVPRSVFDGPVPLLAVTDDTSKASGFATLTSLTAQTPHITMLVDALVGTPLRAGENDRIVFSEERFDRFPDLWTSSGVGPALQISDANPQAGQYAWGHSRLIDYTNARGQKLRAVLTTPDGFDPHRKYPMLVYVYEKMSDDLNRYVQPASGTVVNLARYASRGYVVLQPDIRYRIGHTTASAVDCVSAAVKRVVAMGFIDSKRIGMAGHSYGGYEVNALVTHTNLFRAVESGASDSDLLSLYGGFWETGDVQQSYYETSQGRIGATPWARPDLYVENSPIYFVDRVKAPYLRIQDDKDGFVPYAQGVEFFTALRRAGKEAYMFTFIGENHGLAKQPNKNYWTVHLDEYFDHFLLGTTQPSWMQRNGTLEHRGERDVDALFTPVEFSK